MYPKVDSAPSSMTMILILGGLSRQVGGEVPRYKKTLSDCFFHLKPPEFKRPRRLLPKDLDSSLEKVKNLF
jgi:hypothetical protein